MTARLEDVAAEFVAYWERAGGCGMCGGLPHAETCFVLRFRRVLEAAAQEAETPLDCAVQAISSAVCERGTKGCIVRHAPRPATTEER